MLFTAAAMVNYTHDGDTQSLTVIPWTEMILGPHDNRLYGINCPELATPEGKVARDFAKAWIAQHSPPGVIWPFLWEHHGYEKYGRWLGRLIAVDTKECLNDALISSKNAVVYLPK